MTATTSTEIPRRKNLGTSRALYFGQNPEIVPVCPPVVAPTWTLTIPNNRFNNRRRVILQQGGTLTSVTNATAYAITKNGSSASIGSVFVPGDALEITWTNVQSSGSTILLDFDVVSSSVTLATYYQPVGFQTIRNATLNYIDQPTAFAPTSVLCPALRPTANTFVYNSDGVGIQRFSGTGRMIMQGNGNAMEWAAGLMTTPTPTWPSTNVYGFAHSIYVSTQTERYYVQEGLSNPATFNLISAGQGASPILVLFCVYDDGTAIRYQRSFNSGATWTTFYTSVLPYTPNQTWYVGIASANLSANVVGPLFIESAGILG